MTWSNSCDVLFLDEMKNVPETLLLIFARSAHAEQKEKSLDLPLYAGRRLFASLGREVIRKARLSGMPWLFWDETRQEGRNFAERVTHAVSSAFALGYENIILLGNDCPELSVNDLRKAAAALAEGKSVIGPDTDGGVYLLGLKASAFSPEKFIALPWQKEQLFRTLIESLGEEALILETYHDIDSLSALDKLRGSYRVSREIKRFILHLFSLLVKIDILNSNPRSTRPSLPIKKRRGPPLTLA